VWDSAGTLRLLHVIPSYFPAVRYGGLTSASHGLASALARRGNEVHVYTTTVDGSTDLQVPHGVPVQQDGVAVSYFPSPMLRRLYWSPNLALEMRRTITTFDAVHVHSTYLWPTWAAARIAERFVVPYIVSPHGMLVRRLIQGKNRWVKTAWINLVERRSLRRAWAVHVTSDAEAGEVAAMGFKPQRVCKVWHGVDWSSEFPALAAGPFAGLPRPYALFLGRINWEKGLDRLIAAWNHVPDLHLVIAGNDEGGYLPRLQELVRAGNGSDRIHFVGPASNEHKWALLSAAEMFLLPSYSENFGCVVAEAMAMARPVVVTPEVGISEVVRDAGAGLVAGGSPELLAAAVRSLHADPTLRQDMGDRGRRAALERLSWDAVAADMEALYAAAAERYSATRH